MTGEGVDLLANLRDGAWLDAQQFPPLAYTVPGLIPEGSGLLVGPPKIGKSWFVLTVGLAAAVGGKALSIAVPKRPVFYLALEDGDRRLQDRCRKLLRGDPIPREFQYLIRVEGSVIDTIAAWLDRQLDTPPLVILDTLGKVMPPALPGESAYQRDYRIGTTLKRLVDQYPGMTLLTNHHDRKAAADDFVDSVSGTHGLAGAADTVIVLTRSRHETSGVLKITGRDVPEGEYAVTLHDGSTWGLDGASLEEAAAHARQARISGGVSDRSAEIIAFVAANPPHVRAYEVEEKFGQDARRYIKRLADSGRLRRLSRGLYTSVPSVPSSRGMVKSCGSPVPHDHAATSSIFSSGASLGRSISRPFSNLAPARTSATRCGPLTARQRPSAASSSLNTIASPASLLPGPLVTRVLARTGEKVDSMGFVVRRCSQCSAGKSKNASSASWSSTTLATALGHLAP
jgi:hypothetical protein